MSKKWTPDYAAGRFYYWYGVAISAQYVRNPVSWALYQAWKESGQDDT